ncbi:MAG: hypothetical protein Q7U57_10015 [Methylovulum sp.]|nr:hypothetical protein [Methylovulum sp.]
MSIEARLKTIMQSWQMPIAPDCEHYLMQLIDQAGSNLRNRGLYSDQKKLLEVERNFEKLLVEMTWQAGVLGLHELREPTFHNALSSLCPIFPFC